MNYIVFDLEWNQPIDKKLHNAKLPFEIIEIGAVKLDENRKFVDSFSEIIKPVVYRSINRHTKKIIHIQMKELLSGRPFHDVCRRFLAWCGDDVRFCSWGPQDLTELQRNMNYYGFKPLSNEPIPFYDVQKIFAIWKKEEDVSRALEAAVDMSGIEKDIPFHRAYSDAYYTAKILAEISDNIINKGLTYDLYHLPSSKKNEICHTCGKETYYLTRGYEERSDITGNRRILSICCPKCSNRALRPKVRWYSTNSKIYYGAAVCMVHGPIRAKLRIKKNEFGQYYAEKYIRYCSSKEIDEIREKKQSIETSRKQSPGKETDYGKDILREQISTDKKTT